MKKQEEVIETEPITGKEIENLRLALRDIKSNYRFREYLLDLKVISIKNGVWIVHDQSGYNRLSKINAKLELRQYYEDQDHFNAFPEARDAHFEKISALKNKLVWK